MRIYLDLCCLNRPFDDQGQERVRAEAEAVIRILHRIEKGRDELVTSDLLELEVSANRDSRRRRWVQESLRHATLRVVGTQLERGRASAVSALGFAAFDSLHVACAEAAHADVLLTTDDRFIRAARRSSGKLGVKVENPVEWIEHGEYQDNE